MIAHDLKCRKGHQFEAWFKDLKTFDTQRRKGLIECPRCGASEVQVVFSARAIRGKSLKRAAGPTTAGMVGGVERFLREHFEDVGLRFAEEARKVHYGESEPRNIRGDTTPEEERDLHEEGVRFFKIAIPKPSN